MPGRKRGETRASREFSHRQGLLSMADHAGLVSMLATRRSVDEAINMHSASKTSPDLPTAPASALTTPTNISDVDKSPQAYVWRHSMNREFGGLFQAGTFAPAPA